MPIIGIFGADARKIRTRPLRPPLERMVVHALGGKRIMAVALDLVAQRPDHLRVAKIAPLADIDVAARQLQRRVRANAVDRLDRALQVEQWCDLDESADGDDHKNPGNQDDRVLLEDFMSVPIGHEMTYSAGWSSPVVCASSASPALTVIQRLKAMISAPTRNRAPPAARMM